MNIAVSLSNFQGLSKPLGMDSEVFMGGYTKKPNFIIDSGLMAELNGNEYKVLDFLMRMAYGFGSNTCCVSGSLIRKKTGISKEETFSRAVRKLEQLKLISVARGTGTTNVYTLTLNHHRQTVVPPTNGSTPDNGGYTTPDNGDKTTPDHGGTVKDIFKENFKEKIFVQNAQVQAKQDQVLVEQKLESDRLEKQKAEQEAKANLEAKAKAKAELESQLLKNFELFWSVYPNKKSKKTAFEKFKRIDFKKTSFESIMISLEKQKQSDDWTKNGGQYVPMPQTWIFNERWTDEIQAPVQQQNHTDVNAYWTDQLQAQEPVTDFVPTLVLGEEFN
ncbi:replication protein [Acinetobacter bohemicus]|uniref:replication protein n=1 Tax=Acinetobacter bohemicus TaxID=1435036 RepID=UPI00192C976A|nr:replication protein [Acinetobacter bohemicus]CAD9196691.1 hypothetical protein QAC21B_02844 [Acinetobacter bohemicus]